MSAMDHSADLIVIGGGIHGCSAALHAALRGMSVIVLEKDTVGRHASGVNAGGVRRLGRHFAEVPISQRSMEMWYSIADFLEDDCGFQIAPQIIVAETEDELARLAARRNELNELGFTHEVLLDRSEVRTHLPAVADHVVGGLACLDDGFAQPYQTVFAIQRKAESLGVRFFEHTRAREVRKDGSDWRVETDALRFAAPSLLNAAGAWAGELAQSLGEPAPVEAIAPMMIVTGRLPHFCDAVVGASGRPLSFKQMPNGTVVIGGGRRGRADKSKNLSEMKFPELMLTAQTAIDIFPPMRDATIIRSWSGVEGRMPDDIPVIGPSAQHENLYHAFGFSAHGFQLGPGVGEIMGNLIATGASNAPLQPFSIARFVDAPQT
ncbi:Hydrogen cyanide synthase subunit HcnC precursor [Nereida ignava]|uniref:Hydrogen cyanide synthase subunit HcnC n=1 Tax=Nereida ignava TaxID=282199 RepID=A0A0U1NNF8_9RHOB|nr:FAD-dependent oxidoreductase [Nereida ignava]CRK76275.1 Hydrogen cyanide synthase subunit HcnC precursor [Nereida ignava]SFJ81952.1 sarcosine oxidase subunit beta [Nereida ignava DSM 16309]